MRVAILALGALLSFSANSENLIRVKAPIKAHASAPVEQEQTVFNLVAGVQRGVSWLTAVGSYGTKIYEVEIGNHMRDTNGNRIMAYMIKNDAGQCVANTANATGDGYNPSIKADIKSKEWVDKYSTMIFHTNDGVFATYSNAPVKLYQNGYFREYITTCTLYQRWKDNPGLVTNVEFK